MPVPTTAATVKTPEYEFRVEGDIPKSLLKFLKEEYGKYLEEYVDYFETDFAKRMEKECGPPDCVQIYRENRGWTQEELGRKVGVSRNYVSDWENGHRAVSKEKAKALGKLFRISPDRFI